MSKLLKVESVCGDKPAMATAAAPLLNLPAEILGSIFFRLSLADRGRVGQVCTKWQAATYNSMVWRDVLYRWSDEEMSANTVLFESIIKRGLRRIVIVNKDGRGLDQVVNNLPKVEVLYMNMCSGLNDDNLNASVISKIPHLTTLSLMGCDRITDQSILLIAQNLRKLVYLDLTHCVLLTDASLAAIASGLHHLTHLELQLCKMITDEGICHLAGTDEDNPTKAVPKLKYLGLCGCRELTDRSLLYLSRGQKRIEHLPLTFCDQVTDAGLRHLSKMLDLQELALSSNAEISHVGLRHLQDIALRSLIFDRLIISDFSPLINMTSLRKLSCDGCNGFNDHALQHLANIQSLETLILSYCPISDVGLTHLANGGSMIITLELSMCLVITDKCLKDVARLAHLKELRLHFCRSIRGDGLASLIGGRAKITSLDINPLGALADKSMQHIAHLTDLQSLSLRSMPDDETVKMFANNLLQLRTFKVDNRNQIADLLKLRSNSS